MTNIETLELDKLPQHLIVLGGGYVGLELGQTFRRVGNRVTMVEQSHQIAAREAHILVAEGRRPNTNGIGLRKPKSASPNAAS
jgi:pyruvate/2-oxoglutarate dehydrogenase complex dihydrolipoamide dehydrogenase (E3) component